MLFLKSGHRVRVVKETDSKSVGVSLASSNLVGVGECCSYFFVWSLARKSLHTHVVCFYPTVRRIVRILFIQTVNWGKVFELKNEVKLTLLILLSIL